MASLQSYIDSAGNISTSADGRTITITGDCNIDGALDALPHIDDGVHIIVGTGGRLRSSAGASGRLGGGRVPLRITEQADSHAYGNDNGSGQATNCRFGPGATNTLIHDFIIWTMESRTTRSDFDVPASSGVEFNGVRLVQKWATGGATHFNHIWGSSPKLRENDRCGYALSIRNETNAHGIELVGTMNALFETLLVDNVDIPVNTRNEGATKGSSARVVVKPTGTMTLTGLDTETITESNDGSTNLVQLINPKRVPARTANWSSNNNNGYGSRMEILRDVDFEFMGADDATGTLYADSQASSNGQDANTSIASNGEATIRVRTHWSAYATGTWTDTDSYRFHAVALGFDKYYSGPTNIAVGTNPTKRTANVMTSQMPDGTAVVSKSSGEVSTAADLFNALKTYEVANPTLPAITARLVTMASGILSINGGAELVLDSSASDFIARSGDTYTLKAASGGVDASNGVVQINLGTSYAAPAGTLNLINFPVSSSLGVSSLINITAPQSNVDIYKSDGTPIGARTYSSAGSHGFLIGASDSLADTKIACSLEGYYYRNRTLDISAGGTYNVEFEDLVQQVDAEGNPLLDTSADISGISVAFTLTGQPTFGIPNRSVSVQALYRALHAQYANPLGNKFAAFGRQEISYTVDPLSGNNLYLGADTQLRRSTNSGDSAAVVAAVYGGRGGSAVNDDRGDVIIKPGSDIGRIQRALLTDFDLDSSQAGTQSVGGLLVNIDRCATQMTPTMGHIINQLKLICQSLPRHYYTPWTPGNPAVFFMRGQQRLHDVNKRNWGISNPDGNLEIEPITGYGDFDGNTRVEASLNRGTGDDIVNYAEECTLAFRIKPNDEDGTFILNEMGAMRIRLVMADGVGILKVGHSGDNDYTAGSIAADKWNDIVLTIQRNPNNASYPYVRLSATDGGYDGNASPGVKAIQTWNIDSNEVFGSIASHTGAFYIGATSNGFKGQVSSCYFHPSSTALNYVWETGDHKRAVGWDDYHQIWNGLPGDNSEGLSDDIVEDNVIRALAELASILAKLNHADIANAVLTQPFQAGWSATKENTDALGNFIKWLAANVNTTAPDSASTIAAASATATVGSSEFVKLAKESETTAGVVAGKASVAKDGDRVTSSTFRDLADTKDVRTLTFSEDEDGARTASVEPQPPA